MKAESLPDLMFYAPSLTNADLGSDGAFEPGLPSIGHRGHMDIGSLFLAIVVIPRHRMKTDGCIAKLLAHVLQTRVIA